MLVVLEQENVVRLDVNNDFKFSVVMPRQTTCQTHDFHCTTFTSLRLYLECIFFWLDILYFTDQWDSDREPLSAWCREADREVERKAAAGGPKRSSADPGSHPAPGRLGFW